MTKEYFRCKECKQEFKTFRESKKGMCQECSILDSVSGIIAQCYTCDFPIYRHEKIHRSSEGSYSGSSSSVGVSQEMGVGSEVYTSYGILEGQTESEQWIQCEWCRKEYEKEEKNMQNEKRNVIVLDLYSVL